MIEYCLKSKEAHYDMTMHTYIYYNIFILLCVGAFCIFGLRPFLLWVKELGLAYYLRRTMLRGQFVNKTNILKERQQVIYVYMCEYMNIYIYMLWQKD